MALPSSRESQFLSVATLVAKGLISLDDLWSYLDPADAALGRHSNTTTTTTNNNNNDNKANSKQINNNNNDNNSINRQSYHDMMGKYEEEVSGGTTRLKLLV